MLLPVGVSVVCPGWVHTAILDADRNWPAELGERPQPNAGTATIAGHYRKAIDNGLAPATVADTVVDAVEHGRFWVFPQAKVLDLAVRRFNIDRRAQGPDACRTDRRTATPKPTRRRGQGGTGPQRIVLTRLTGSSMATRSLSARPLATSWPPGAGPWADADLTGARRLLPG